MYIPLFVTVPGISWLYDPDVISIVAKQTSHSFPNPYQHQNENIPIIAIISTFLPRPRALRHSFTQFFPAFRGIPPEPLESLSQ